MDMNSIGAFATIASLVVALIALWKSSNIGKMELIQFLRNKDSLIDELKTDNHCFVAIKRKQEIESLFNNRFYAFDNNYPFILLFIFAGALLSWLGTSLILCYNQTSLSEPYNWVILLSFIFSLLPLLCGIVLIVLSFIVLMCESTRFGVWLEEKMNPYIGDTEESVIPLSEAEMLESYGPSTLLIDIRTRSSYRKAHLPDAINIPYFNYRKQKKRNKYRDRIDCTKKIIVEGLGYGRCYEIANHIRREFKVDVFIAGRIDQNRPVCNTHSAANEDASEDKAGTRYASKDAMPPLSETAPYEIRIPML